MARRTVHCPCGGDFAIPEVPPSLLHCPYCGEPVRYRAAGDPGGSFKVREEIQEPLKPVAPGNPWYPLYILGGAGILVAAGLVALIVVFSDREAVRHPAVDEGIRAKARQKVEETFTSIKEIPIVPPTPRKTDNIPEFKLAPPVERFDTVDGLARAQRLSTRLNLMGVVSTFYHLSNRVDEDREIQGLMSKDDTDFRELLPHLEDMPEFQAFRQHFRPGDVMTAFGPMALNASQPKPFVEALREWLVLAQAGTTVIVGIQREGRAVVLPMWFLEIPADLLPTEFRPAPPAAPALTRALPAELLAEAKQRLAALHPYYRKGLPADDAARFDALVQAASGTLQDVEFLRNRILAYCGRCESERAGFESKVAALEGALAQAQTTDTLVFKDGRKVQGQIEEEGDDYVRLRGRFGAVRSPKSEILRIDRGDPFGVEFRRRYDAARGKPSELASVLGWCREKNLVQHRDLAAYALLKDDPGNDAAWTALGVADRVVAPTGPEFDVVWLNDGTRREGIITAETATAIQIDLVVRGTKAETIGTGKASIAKTDVARIERMNEAARKRAKDRALSFAERGQKTQEAVARVLLAPDSFVGLNGYRAAGTVFELHSTLPAAQVRETAHMLDEMFNAFRRHFSVRRNAAKKIDVYFLANSAEYATFQKATRGGVALNPAYFDTQANHVAAYYGVQSAEESRIRGNILASEREIEEYKKRIAAEEDRISKVFRALRQEILDAVASARRSVGDDPKAQAAIDRNKQESLNTVKAQERSALEYLAKLRREANQSIQQHEAMIRHNQAVLVSQTKEMYEILFHESFHAFAANFLWEEADNAGLPRWLHEGMASYFERSVVEAGELVHGGVHPSFLSLLRTQQQNNALMPVATLVTAGHDLFQIQHTGEIPRQELAYAHAWGIAHYLVSRGVTRERLEAYVVDLSAGKSRITAFETLAGKKIADVEAEWRVHLSNLR
jgi:hypothetical protein